MAATRLIRAALALSIVVAAACNSASPAEPSRPTDASSAGAHPSGLWVGTFEITSCAGTPSCHLAPEKFALRLAADGTGVLQIDANVWFGAPSIAVDVTSHERPDRTLLLTGTAAASRNAVVQLTLQTPVADSLSGLVRYSVDDASGRVTKDGRILFAGRDRTVAFSRFHGIWAGFITRECAGDCGEFDPVLGSGGVRLDLSQAGALLTGRFNNEELAGAVSGDTFTATSRTELPPDRCRPGWDEGTTCLIDLTVTAAVDSMDRLHGSIAYRVEAVTYNNRRFAFDARADLTGIVRWP